MNQQEAEIIENEITKDLTPEQQAHWEKIKQEALEWGTDFEKTGIPKCMTCKIPMIKETEYSWKPGCNCISKDLRLGII